MSIKAERKLYLDGWRGLSIALVLAGHFTALPSARWGALGVSFFFALSGRLMGEILFEQRFPVGPFLLRRFSRVWPVLLVFVAASMVLSRITTFWGTPLSAAGALSALTFTLGYARLWGVGGEQVTHIWSLCIEEHSYLMLLLVAGLASRNINRASWLLAIVAAGSIADGLYRSLVLGGDYYAVYWLTDPMLHFISVSVLAHLWREKLVAMAGAFAGYASVVLMLVAVALAYHRVPAYVTQTAMPFVLGVAVALLPVAKRQVIAALEFRPLTLLGVWSYSIYIWQQPLHYLGEGQTHLIRAGLLLLAVIIGAASYYGLEQPARRFLNRRFGSRTAVEPVEVLGDNGARDGVISISTASARQR